MRPSAPEFLAPLSEARGEERVQDGGEEEQGGHEVEGMKLNTMPEKRP
jgi:hypothetical protein